MDALITRRSGSSSEYNGKFDYSLYDDTYGGSILSLLTGINLKDFDTSELRNMGNMFQDCSSLQSLDLSNFNTSRVSNTKSMFNGCNALETLYVRSEADKTKLTAGTGLRSTCKVIVGKPS